MTTILNPTLAQIVTASNESGIPIADIILAIEAARNTPTIVPAPAQSKTARYEARKPQSPKVKPLTATERRAKRTRKPVATIDAPAWRSQPASKAQGRRILAAEEAILESGRKRGIALILRGAEREAARANAGAASDYYKTLAAFTRKHGIKFSA